MFSLFKVGKSSVLSSIRPQLQTGIGYSFANLPKKMTPIQLTKMFQFKFSNDKEPRKKEDSEPRNTSAAGKEKSDKSIQAIHTKNIYENTYFHF